MEGLVTIIAFAFVLHLPVHLRSFAFALHLLSSAYDELSEMKLHEYVRDYAAQRHARAHVPHHRCTRVGRVCAVSLNDY